MLRRIGDCFAFRSGGKRLLVANDPSNTAGRWVVARVPVANMVTAETQRERVAVLRHGGPPLIFLMRAYPKRGPPPFRIGS